MNISIIILPLGTVIYLLLQPPHIRLLQETLHMRAGMTGRIGVMTTVNISPDTGMVKTTPGKPKTINLMNPQSESLTRGMWMMVASVKH